MVLLLKPQHRFTALGILPLKKKLRYRKRPACGKDKRCNVS